MCFPEAIILKVKKRADFTCCWCQNRQHKVEAHHIIPRKDSGPDTEDNAAPLCSNCHTNYGNNPDFRKEIKARRDYWYETCLKRLEFSWSPSLHIPLLDRHEYLIPQTEKTTKGTNVREGEPRLQLMSQKVDNGISPLQISVCYKPPPIIRPYPKTLSITAEIPFGFLLSIEVCALSDWDLLGFIETLRNKKDIWMLRGYPIPNRSDDPVFQPRDYLFITRMNDGENRMIIGAYMPTQARVAIRARFTDSTSIAIADYLEKEIFLNHGDSNIAANG